jgi:hypothetical protein
MTTVSGYITRSSLSLSNLAFGLGTPYYIDGGSDSGAGGGNGGSGLQPGQVVKSRVWATSPYVAGGVQVLSVAGIVTTTAVICVDADSHADLQSDLTTLMTAVEQSSYTLSITFDSTTYAWSCFDADYQIAPFPMQFVFGYFLPVTLTIPASPTPVSGPV